VLIMSAYRNGLTRIGWLGAPNSEPAWLNFLIQQIRPRDY